MDIPDLSKLSERFDFFKVILGFLLLFSSVYIFFNYYVLFPNENSSSFFLFLLALFYFAGVYFFGSGYTDMEYNYLMDTDIKELKYIVEMSSLREQINSDIGKLNINKEEKERLIKQIDNKIKEFIKE